mmetsp:Transcript_7204/g.44796  ORF Transcript_7204/g.44796 Transcript_7204/m.44796 type:complete len:81 (+) Transcript_7204:3570-3812(+)
MEWNGTPRLRMPGDYHGDVLLEHQRERVSGQQGTDKFAREESCNCISPKETRGSSPFRLEENVFLDRKAGGGVRPFDWWK